MGSFWVTASPFILAAFVELFSPISTCFWKERMGNEVGDIGCSGDIQKIKDVLEQSIDAVRMVTTSLLTIVSGLIALPKPTEYLIWAFGILNIILLVFYFMNQDVSYYKYVSKGKAGYTPVSIIILAENAVIIALIGIPILTNRTSILLT